MSLGERITKKIARKMRALPGFRCLASYRNSRYNLCPITFAYEKCCPQSGLALTRAFAAAAPDEFARAHLRKLQQLGAVAIKNSVYVLPFNERLTKTSNGSNRRSSRRR